MEDVERKVMMLRIYFKERMTYSHNSFTEGFGNIFSKSKTAEASSASFPTKMKSSCA